jgi:hypothetical protein
VFTRQKLRRTSFAARRCAALLGAAALLTGTLASAFAGPAAAGAAAKATVGMSKTIVGQAKTTLKLSNESQYGTYASAGVVNGSAINIDESPGQWVWSDLGTRWTGGNPKISGENVEFSAMTQNGTQTNWCLSVTGGTDAYLQACGNYGTVWVEVKEGNGDYLYNRNLASIGENDVLAVHDPTAGRAVGVVSEPALRSGDGWYARWTFLGS